ncbi:ABC transporter substrate-binding protein [Paenibacillus kobensis]|uniref:ABC transporter substrate-binding protein n=1 Tax=Paenibacillus kobensis TaxID=59841 RepID=UPI0013E37CC8|nr:extracellular solute-binding protein [Paenibacillus kobensis]
MESSDLTFDVVPLKQIYGEEGKDPDKELQKLISEEHFDFIFLKQLYQYDDLLHNNKLAPIDQLVKDGSLWNQSVIKQLSRDGSIYGFSPTFYADALFINKSLFEQTGVPLPSEDSSMDWNQYFQTLNRFGPENAGMSTSSNAGLFALILGTLQGLTFYQNDNIVLATSEWEKVFDQVRQAFKDKAIRIEDSIDPMNGDLFEQGKVAFKFETSDYIRSLQEKQNQAARPFEWMVAPMPHQSDSSLSNVPFIHLNEIAAIPADTANKKQAEEFLSFIMGEKMTRVFQQQGELTTRNMESNNDKSVKFSYLRNMDFSSQTTKSYNEIMMSMPDQYYSTLLETVGTVMNELMESNTATMEGLQQIETAMLTAPN